VAVPDLKVMPDGRFSSARIGPVAK